MTFTQSELTNIVSAAAASVGAVDPAVFDVEVAKRAAQIVTVSSADGRVGKFLNDLSESEPFLATIYGVKIEPNTKRGLVVLKAKPSDRTPDGIETIRTDIVDGNPLALALLGQIKAAKGQKAFVYKFLETNGDKKFRVVKAIQVIGEDPEFNAESAREVAIATFNEAQKK
jgi:hypothetical protein